VASGCSRGPSRCSGAPAPWRRRNPQRPGRRRPHQHRCAPRLPRGRPSGSTNRR
jgi:hypothetical protein